MKRELTLLFVLVVVGGGPGSAEPPRTMRVDYYHTGDASRELFSLDRVVIEPLPWPGNPDRAVDNTNTGKYLFEVRDRATNTMLYSRGFSSIYGEWETTAEAKSVNRTYSESLRFPAPEKTVQVILKKRDAQNSFREIWTFTLEPRDKFVDRSAPAGSGGPLEIEKNGDPAKKLDLLILGDGYTANEKSKFERDARRLTAILFQTEPFKTRRSDFNVWALCPASEESGISRPSSGVHRRTPIRATYDAFDTERYILTFDNKAFRDIAASAPYDVVEILVNNNIYGGGGIFNLYGMVATDSFWAPYIFVHEFGHHLAGLADEYYTSEVAYLPASQKVEPWEPNATVLLNKEELKWGALVSKNTPVPTPWNKDGFDSYSREIQSRRHQLIKEGQAETVMEALMTEQKDHEEKLFREEKYAGTAGAFEGANYEATGYFRPEVNCIMFTRTDYFCRVCRMAIERMIDLHSRP